IEGCSGEIRSTKVISNHASVSTGGGLRIVDSDITVINSEFSGNEAKLHGGGVWGRATFVTSAFYDNHADGEGNGLFAPAGPPMTLRNVAAWPDDLVASSMILDHSCVTEVTVPHTNEGSVFIVANPFVHGKLDGGLIELYLDPTSACVDIGGTVDEFDWTTMTTQASQCTDVTPLDAGVHYTPLSSAGPC